MKTILVPVSGTSTDRSVFATALSLGRALPGAHLEFYHLRLDPCESALRDPHSHFCIGPAIGATLSHFEARDRSLAVDSAHHFQDFCETNDIPVLETPVAGQSLSAEWTEEINYPEERLLFHARHSDVTGDTLTVPDTSRSIAQQLAATAASEQADLVVIGGYGHNAFREHYFGGVTRDLLASASLPILLMH